MSMPMPTSLKPSTPGIFWMRRKKSSGRSFSAPPTIPTCSTGSSRENRSGFRPPTLTEQELIALSKQTGRELKTAPEARELRDVELRLKHMDKLGIDVQILFNTMWIARVADKAEAEIALCKSWNRWMAEVWKQGNNRLRWSCVVPAMTLNEAIQQMRFAKENGAVAVSLRPFEDDKHLVDPYFYPIYEEATRLDLAVAVHIANGSPQLMDQFKPRYDRMGGFAQFRIPTVITCLSLMMSDVPNNFSETALGLRRSFRPMGALGR